jgi:hypothetical protein
MAVGDVVADTASVADTAYMDIQPASGAEWVIHNLYWADDSELYKYDGTNAIAFQANTGAGALLNAQIHVNNTDYLRIKNVSGGAAICGYDGIITKVAS